MKKYDSVSIIGAIACIGVIVYTFATAKPPQPPAEATDNAPVAQVDSPNQAAQPAQATAPATETPASVAPQAVVPAAGSAKADDLLPVGANPRKLSGKAPVVLTREGEMEVSIDPVGGGVTNVKLLKYKMEKDGDIAEENVALGGGDYPFLAVTSSKAERLPWQAAAEADCVVDQAKKSVSVTRKSTDGTLAITETWRIPEKRYEIEYAITVKNLSGVPQAVNGLVLEAGAISPWMEGTSSTKIAPGGAAYMIAPFVGNHCKSIEARELVKATEARSKVAEAIARGISTKDAEGGLQKASNIAWACLHTRYFMQGICGADPAYVFPEMEAFACEYQNGSAEHTDPTGRFRARLQLQPIEIPAGESKTVSFRGLVGPMDLNDLSEKGMGLDGMLGVDRFFWGSPAWMGGLSKFFLNSMVWLSKMFGDSRMALGFGLILLTIIVKLILWPLSYRGMKSMMRMQALQPQLKELREKFKNDPQEMYRRQRELFKENNVSQLGGCLPLLIQIPIFFALFNTFRGSIELRQASFLWATDLSLPDTVCRIGGFLAVNPFSVIMVGTMLWQQMTTTTSGEPSQKKMMLMMSLVFAYFLYTQPSGLTLYMTANQLMSMLQTYIAKRMLKKGAVTTTPAKA